ncbi:MAG: hypothetical protein WC414_03905 [Patescibacteria group bacterium]
MNKIKFLLAIAFFIAFPMTVKAINLGFDLVKNTAETGGYSSATGETSLAENIGFVINVILSFVGVIFTGLTVYAGILWMTARGDEGKVEKAKNILTGSIIGLFIALAAYSITNYIIPLILAKV